MRNKTSYLPWLMVLLGGVFYSYEYMVRVSPSVMIPELMKSFSIQATEIGLLSSFYYWGYVAGSCLVGPMIDKYAPKRIIVLATMICAAGCCFFSMSHSLFFAEISRLIVGFGSAFAFIGLLSIGAMWLAPKHFGRLAGMSSMLGMLSATIGQKWFSHLMEKHTWQDLSFFSGMVGILIALFLLFVLRDKKRPVNSCTQTTYTFNEFIATFKLVGKQGAFWKNCLIGLTTFLPIIIFSELWGVPFLEHRYDIAREAAVADISKVFLGWAVGAPSFGLLYDLLKQWRNVFWYGTLVALMASMAVLYVALPSWLLPYFLFIFGFSASSHVLVFVSTKRMCSDKVAATSLGLTNLIMMSAGVIVQPIIGGVIDYLAPFATKMGMTVSIAQSYQCALSLLPLALFWTLFLINNVGRYLAETQESENPEQLLLVER